MPGTLFVVATPIGNLEDITLRALRTLREVDLIAAEDTRRTAKLLAHYEIRRPLASLHEHNEHRETPRLVARIQNGASIALVSDAGTPGIADPGANLVRTARQAGLKVVAVPGPSAISAALSVSGAPANQFAFLGFPPSSGAAREQWLLSLSREPKLTVFFEAPHRVERTLGELRQLLVNRPINIFRELTKIHEELAAWPSESSLRFEGEFVVAVFPTETDQSSSDEATPEQAADIFGRLTNNGLFDEQAAFGIVGYLLNVPGSRARKLVKQGRIAAKRRDQRSS
jgi:16S rRNA (cytidine1402-2'-O)-methyltransferase